MSALSGTSGGTSPTVIGYNGYGGVGSGLMVDGGVTWLLVARANFSGMVFATGASQNYVDYSDVSGSFTNAGILVAGGAGITIRSTVPCWPGRHLFSNGSGAIRN